MTTIHPQVQLARDPIQVDEEAANLVAKINQLPHTHTLFSCQGDKPEVSRAYVLFITDSPKAAEYIRGLVSQSEGARYQVETSITGLSIHHHIAFDEVEHRRNFEKLMDEQPFRA
jgi:hypothetical protein